jgi:ubiquinone biosynthesis monooxygenase Coq7
MTTMNRAFHDRWISGFDRALRAVAGVSQAMRPNPAHAIAETDLGSAERRLSAGLMRVNHVGEVCAQALYDAQGRFAADLSIRKHFERAGAEEQDHLAWTAERLRELGASHSLLNPLWYAGAYALGTVAATLGTGPNLGFVMETERQVEAHLASHLERLPAADGRSRAIVAQMRADEAAHSDEARAMGATELPLPVKKAMAAAAKVMTTTAYYL